MAATAPMKREMLYAPSAPFAEAMEEWIGERRRRYRAVRNSRTPQGTPVRTNGLEDLARLSRIDARRLRAYQTGESRYISIDNADRLCIALGVALWVLADDFKTMPAWRRELREQAA